ncbi:MAG: TIR domain-containing protein [Candidatus Poribacteria bacterium]|nr:TIR domain-containing protein [Candidatus Poribacteria bacterium]
MARKIFVSYKHSDDSVEPIKDETTARAYVDELIEIFEDDEIYKGEGDEDLSEFKDETIETHLKDKIYDSSVTLVLISPNMKELLKNESDQWIPWEISYSLKEITRNERTSQTNGMLAIVLPDSNSSYSYYLEENTCTACNCRTLHTNTLFQILRDNMFNVMEPTFSNCPEHPPETVYKGHSSYIYSVKWSDFIGDTDKYLDIVEEIRENINDYDITKTVKD